MSKALVFLAAVVAVLAVPAQAQDDDSSEGGPASVLKGHFSWSRVSDLTTTFLTLLGTFVFYTICAVIYRHCREVPDIREPSDDDHDHEHNLRLEREELKDWSTGLCGCFDDMGICCVTFWCPMIRFAENVSMLGLANFWVAFFIFTILHLMSSFYGISYVLLCIILAYYRHEIREKFEFEERGGMTCVKDCCCYFWCDFCTISQDARHLDLAAELNHQHVKRVAPHEKNIGFLPV